MSQQRFLESSASRIVIFSVIDLANVLGTGILGTDDWSSVPWELNDLLDSCSPLDPHGGIPWLHALMGEDVSPRVMASRLSATGKTGIFLNVGLGRFLPEVGEWEKDVEWFVYGETYEQAWNNVPAVVAAWLNDSAPSRLEGGAA